ncbi:MAG: hypothetical protein AABX73_04555 [Nanoarchaeota archaeon]
MKKYLLALPILIILAFQLVLAVDLEIKKIDRGSVVISELNNPAIFDFIINNKGSGDNFEIYSLVGVSMSPRGTFELPSGKTTIEVNAYPSEEIRKIYGFYQFEYQIKGQNSGIMKDNLLIKIVTLPETLEIVAEPITPSDSSALITIKNKENTNIENIKMEFISPFFETSKEISLKPYEQAKVQIEIDTEKSRKMLAGSYPLILNVQIKNAKTEIKSYIDYLEKEGTSFEKQSQGFIIKKTALTRTNEGNIPAKAVIEIKKDFISRLFTTTSPEPSSINRKSLYVTYVWEKEIGPDEFLTISSTTNYTIPFIIIILIIAITLLVKIYSQTPLILSKKVSFVRTKSGEFALKVTLYAKAKKHVDKIQIIDKLPAMTKLYEKFGKTPDKIDHNSNRLFWNIDKLTAGEERIYTYIIYSRFNIVGRFELPAATAIFEKDGKTEEVWSNRTFFAAETVHK